MPNALLRRIQHAVQAGRLRISDHALTRMLERNIDIQTTVDGINGATLLEDYSLTRHEPRILVVQSRPGGRTVHAVWEATETNEAVLVTVFDPEV